jgi:hypothetical protein
MTPLDEMAMRDGERCCLECLSKSGEEAPTEILSEEQLAALIADFMRLHAEEKKIKDELESVKERLKRRAASEPRVNNAVLLRAGEKAVKCGYSTRISYDAEKLAEAETILGEDQFAELFSREVKFIPIKDRLESFLNDENAESEEARAMILESMERKEIMTITPASGKRENAQQGEREKREIGRKTRKKSE